MSTNPDSRLLFATRIVRMFSYGLLAVILALYLSAAGLSDAEIGLLLTLTLLGDTLISLWITTRADRFGRKRMLLIGSVLMIFAGGLFAFTRDFYLLLFAATIGVISPSGNEVGPFLAIEQSALAQTLPAEKRTQVFAWYQLAGSLATALGSLAGGGLAEILQNGGTAPLSSYRVIILIYAAFGLALGVLFNFVSPRVEVPANGNGNVKVNLLGLGKSSKTVIRLAALFSVDAFAGGFVVQSIVAYWFHVRYGVNPATLGAIFFGANIFAGISALSAAWIAKKIGLLNTMVFTHVPSNILLILVPLMPNLPLAITMLLLRFSISQMDVPTRQSYTLAVVSPEERSSAAGVTGIARTLGASLAPVFAAPLIGIPALSGLPFIISGVLKLVYDFSLFHSFKTIKPPEEQTVK
ncbi:MAG: MFS transporter [Anaerolineales bacterium]|nr:MFS transporter [Anaerolineales bacterium]